MSREWVTVEFAGPETRIETSLCSHCPRGEAGCCATPPPYSLAEIGRVAAVPGGGAWLAQEVAAGRLLLQPETLQPAQVAGACVYWQRGRGCTLEPAQRPAQCNFFICGEALQLAGLAPGEGYGPAPTAAAEPAGGGAGTGVPAGAVDPAGGGTGTGVPAGGLDPVRRAHTDLLRLYDRWHGALLQALQRMGLAPLDAARLPELTAALAHWWRAQAGQWQRVAPGLPGEGRRRFERQP